MCWEARDVANPDYLASAAGLAEAKAERARCRWYQYYPETGPLRRGRYPKHPWPEDPLRAEPTRRAKPRPERS